jgi:ABC-type transport system substrate-binding protein
VNRRDRFAIVALFVALAVVGAALLLPGPSSGPHASSSPVAIKVPFREGVLGHPSSVNPLTTRSQVDQDLVALLFRGLVKTGPDGAVVPDLATWTASADGLTYTFQMRNDAYWEDGQPVTSADVLFTVGLVKNAQYEGPIGASWQGVDAKAEGPYTVTFTMTLPSAGFLRQAELPILPSHLLEATPITSLADSSYSSRPIGDGPYRILELDYSHALLERVPSVAAAPTLTLPPAPPASSSPVASLSPIVFATDTPTAGVSAGRPNATSPAPLSPSPSLSPGPSPSASPTPAPTPPPTQTATPTPTPVPLPSGAFLTDIPEIELIFYDDPASAAADFLAGKLDAVGGLTPQATDAALTAAGSRLVSYPWASLLSVVVNQRQDHAELRDVNLRTGLLAAIDRRSLLASVLESRGSTADDLIPSWSPWYDPSAVVAVPYNAVGAAADLTDAAWSLTSTGWALPKATGAYTMQLLTLDEASNAVLYQTALQVADAWRAIGLVVQVDAVPASSYLERLDSGQFDSAIVDFDVGLDPDLGPLLLSSQVGSGGSNVSGVQDKALDQLLLSVRKTVDPAARQAAVSALEKYISTSLPILPLAFRDYDLVVSSRVYDMASNDIADPSGRFWDVVDWRLASGR